MPYPANDTMGPYAGGITAALENSNLAMGVLLFNADLDQQGQPDLW